MKTLPALCLVISTMCAAHAEESLPAVSGFNGKVDYSGGWMDSLEEYNLSGSITLPLTKHFGLQADGLFSHLPAEISDGGTSYRPKQDFFGGAGHFFWRNPEIGLVGLVGGGLKNEHEFTSYQTLLEAEYYFPRVTVGAMAGVGHISYGFSSTINSILKNYFGIDPEPTLFVGTLSLNWYALDNLRVGASYSYLLENHLGKLEAEYQTSWKGLCLTAEYAQGENRYDEAFFGIRFYFGKDKSLKARHREDDPPSLTRHLMTTVWLYEAEFE